MTPDDLYYSAEHEWVRKTAAGAVRLGITDYAQAQLGDVVNVLLPDVGDKLVAGTAFGEVESTKSVSDLVAPLSGRVQAVNEDLTARPELVNSDPYGRGWMLEVQVDGPLDNALADLHDAAGYRDFVKT